MNARKVSLRAAIFGAIVACGAVAAYGCSSNNNNNGPGPTQHDSGTDGTTSSSGSTSDGSTDAPTIDTGSCVTDASGCNSCYNAQQAAQDPLNACAPSTVNCIPFDNTKVPAHPTL
jgi:hypothetical protein